jgi:hypothetical protein
MLTVGMTRECAGPVTWPPARSPRKKVTGEWPVARPRFDARRKCLRGQAIWHTAGLSGQPAGLYVHLRTPRSGAEHRSLEHPSGTAGGCGRAARAVSDEYAALGRSTRVTSSGAAHGIRATLHRVDPLAGAPLRSGVCRLRGRGQSKLGQRVLKSTHCGARTRCVRSSAVSCPPEANSRNNCSSSASRTTRPEALRAVELQDDFRGSRGELIRDRAKPCPACRGK